MADVWTQYTREKVDKLDPKKKPVKPKEEAPPAEEKPPKKKPVAPPCYYAWANRSFWSQNSTGEWMDLNESGIRRKLKEIGFRSKLKPGETISPLESAMFKYQHQFDVHFACALAGFEIGVQEILGNRILVNRQRKVIEPKPGKWNLLKSVLEQLLGNQFVYVKGWLKEALDVLAAGPPFGPGQVLILAGPSGCGKSFFQDVVTEILGGRVGMPWEYFTGASNFNEDLFEAEHLMIEDQAPPGDLKTRRTVGAKLKGFVANKMQRMHPKGGKGKPITPFWRITFTLNDEPENLMCLPPVDDSLKDKLIILKAKHVKFPYGASNKKARKRFRDKISAELPAFLHYLHQWQIPEKIRDERYGIRAAQNPELMNKVNSLSPQYKLLELIDQVGLWEWGANVWEGTASSLEKILKEKNRTGEVASVLSYNTACGVFLSRLEDTEPSRIQSERLKGGVTKYKIFKREE